MCSTIKRDPKVIFLKTGLAYIKLEDEKSLTEALKDVERTHMERKIKIVRAQPLSEKPLRENLEKKQDTNGERP